MDLHNCRCPTCHHQRLDNRLKGDPEPEVIHPAGIVCPNCGAEYDVIWGVPYLGTLGADDLLSLIEIAANIGTDRSKDSAAGPTVDAIHRMLGEYHLAPVKANFVGPNGERPNSWGWWGNRWNEHVMVQVLTHGLELAGRRVLDVGAGSGFDTMRFVHAGARVTALEFNPLLLARGQRSFPDVTWIGGSARVLPFCSGAFDLVAVNAALHHMRDLATTVGELLRVLKPGGCLITLCDSFRPDNSDDDIELNIFNDHPDVLLGVNEQVPRFRDFVSTLCRHRKALDIQIITHHLDSLPDKPNMMYPRAWNLAEALAVLPYCSGALALAVRLRQPVQADPPRTDTQLIGCAEYAERLTSPPEAIAALARKVPQEYVNLPLHDDRHGKFRLLNGWKKTVPGQAYRTAFARGRLFFNRQPQDRYLVGEVLAPHVPAQETATLRVFLDGRLRLEEPLTRGLWTRFSLDVAQVPIGQSFALEAQLDSSLTEPETRLLNFRQMAMAEQALPKRLTRNDLAMYGLEALCAVGLIGPSPVPVLLAPSYPQALEILNRMRCLGLEIEAVVAEGQEKIFAWEPGVRVIETYPEPVLHPTSPYQIHTAARLLAAPCLETARMLAVNLPAQGRGGIQVVLPGGHCQELYTVTEPPSPSRRFEIDRLLRRFGRKSKRTLQHLWRIAHLQSH